MATTKLKLRNDRVKLQDSTTVYVQVCIDSKIKLYSTGCKLKVEFWDEVGQRLKKSWGYGYEKHFAKINKRKLSIDSIIDQAVMNNTKLTFDFITQELEKLPKAGAGIKNAMENVSDSLFKSAKEELWNEIQNGVEWMFENEEIFFKESFPKI